MKMSDTGLAMLTALEGERSTMYRDQVGLPTVGVGHRLTLSELHSGELLLGAITVPWRDGLSPLAIEALLAHDTAAVASALSRAVTVPLTEPQFDALVSWAFNVGIDAAVHSTLVKRLNQGQYDAGPDQLRQWVKGHLPDGAFVPLPVLVKRREVEIVRWESAT